MRKRVLFGEVPREMLIRKRKAGQAAGSCPDTLIVPKKKKAIIQPGSRPPYHQESFSPYISGKEPIVQGFYHYWVHLLSLPISFAVLYMLFRMGIFHIANRKSPNFFTLSLFYIAFLITMPLGWLSVLLTAMLFNNDGKNYAYQYARGKKIAQLVIPILLLAALSFFYDYVIYPGGKLTHIYLFPPYRVGKWIFHALLSGLISFAIVCLPDKKIDDFLKPIWKKVHPYLRTTIDKPFPLDREAIVIYLYLIPPLDVA